MATTLARMNPLLAALVAASTFAVPASAQGCSAPDTTALWYRLRRAWTTEEPHGWTNDSLRRRLLEMERDDQAERRDFGMRWNDTIYVRSLMRTDSLRALELESILDHFGVPTRALVGAKGSDAAMIIVQHNPRLEPRVLAMAKALPRGYVSMEKLAMLEDRLLVAARQPQIYATQFSSGGSGVFRLDSLADPAHVASRRDSAWLPPLASYVCQLEQTGIRIDRSTLPPR
jgi:hypothetical protein